MLLMVLTACSNSIDSIHAAPSPTSRGGQYLVEIHLRNLYQDLGGAAELGLAISQPRNFAGGAVCQYTTNVMLCYNGGSHSETERVYLAPLAKEFNLQSTPAANGLPPAIYEGFAEVYARKFFGERYVGAPLTSAQYNPEKRRLEQYFERMGFYTLIDDPQKKVHLLAYGSYACREDCVPNLPNDSMIGWNKSIPLLLPKVIDRVGGYSLFGDPISIPYLDKKDRTLQILDKIVVYTTADNPQVLQMLPLAVELNMPLSAPGPQGFGSKNNMVFYVIHDNVGYHVPIMFDQFIAKHGGTEISGQPLSDPYELNINNQRVARQCFKNLCLDYALNGNEEQHVSLVSLGQMFLETQKLSNPLEPFEFNRATVALNISVKKAQLTNQESQIIQIALLTRKSRLPIANVYAFVMIELPNGKKISYNLPLTNKDGLTQVILQPLSDVVNGMIIPYVVCLNVPAEEVICANESFLVWNNR